MTNLTLFCFNFDKQIDLVLLFKTGEKLRRLANIDGVDWCESVRNIKNIKNAFAKRIIREVKEASPNLFRKCPLFGRYEINNFTLSKSYINMIPAGSYIIKVSLYDQLRFSQIQFNVSLAFNVVP